MITRDEHLLEALPRGSHARPRRRWPGAAAARRGAAGHGAVALAMIALVTGCATGGTATPESVGEAGPPTPTGTAPGSRPTGETGLAAILPPDQWPDACELGRGAGEVLVGPEPRAGTLPDGTPLDGARECRWDVAGGGTSVAPADPQAGGSAGSRGELTLRVVIATADVLEAWAGYQYTAGLRQDVTGVGDEAFLVPAGTGGTEVLWVCKGQTILTLVTAGLSEEEARDLVLDVGRSVSDELDGTPAGTPPSA